VELFAGSTKVGEDTVAPYHFTWESTQKADGSVTLTAYAYDAATNKGNSGPYPVLVDNIADNPGPTDTTPPTVSFGGNLAGTVVSGTVKITVNAADNQQLSLITLSINGKVVASTNISPLSYSWNTRKASVGSHTVTAVATDVTGNTAQAQQILTIDSGGGSGGGSGGKGKGKRK